MDGVKLKIAEKVLFLVACLSVGIATYTNTAMMTAIPLLVKLFHLTPTLAQWSIDLFLVLSVSLIIPAGKLAEKYGTVKFYMLGLILFLLGSVTVIFSQDVLMLLLGRALEGAGFGFIMPLSLQLLKETLPDSFHGAATAVWAGILSLGFGAGPTIGGLFVFLGSWRGIFWLSAIAMVVFLLGLISVLPSLKFKSRVNVTPKKVHFYGFISFTVAVISLVYFLIQVQQDGFLNPLVDVFIIISIISFVIFYRVSKNHESPYVNILFFKNRETFLSITGVFFTMFALFQTLYFYSSYLQNYYTMGLNAVAAGASLLLVSLVIFIFSLFIAKVAARVSERRLKIMGMMFTTLGFLFLFLFSEVHGFLWAQLACLIILGVGMGISYPLFPGSGMRAVVSENVSSLAGVISVASGLGCAVGVAVGGIIYKLYFQASIHIGEKIMSLNDLSAQSTFVHAAHMVSEKEALPFLAHLPQGASLAIEYAVGSGFSHTMLLCALVTIIRALIGSFWPREIKN